MHEVPKQLNVDEIEYDTNNPRIKKALEKYGEKLTADRIHFALRSAADGDQTISSYKSLQGSIRASRGIVSPISVIEETDGGYVCIDGNTRLAIYKQFRKDEVAGDWATIKANVLQQANEKDIETIRVSAHLVGAREWPAYEKARHLHYLYHQNFMSFDEVVALCGGNKKDIERQIDAYNDMNEYYRDVVADDTAFHIDRFSGFVELQKPKVKESIYEAGLEMSDFGEWIRDGKIYKLQDVRKLPQVLGDDEARSIFLNGGPRSIENALKHLDQKEAPEDNKLTLSNASIQQLARALSRRINDLTFAELGGLRNGEDDAVTEQLETLDNLSSLIGELLENVRE